MDGFDVDFAPDEHHNANIGGFTHTITSTQLVADPVVRGVRGRPDISLVDR
ncbi:hypothetical protein [Nocardia sp. NPDC057440]|uniref:hypothetical protein n=1 Tax=Nocardia sp. NPDC057440 TaxID=3346134 RepID=UPI00367351AB